LDRASPLDEGFHAHLSYLTSVRRRRDIFCNHLRWADVLSIEGFVYPPSHLEDKVSRPPCELAGEEDGLRWVPEGCTIAGQVPRLPRSPNAGAPSTG
jgi:hypothetical protein